MCAVLRDIIRVLIVGLEVYFAETPTFKVDSGSDDGFGFVMTRWNALTLMCRSFCVERLMLKLSRKCRGRSYAGQSVKR